MADWQQIQENLLRIAKRRAALDAEETRLLREAHRLGVILMRVGITKATQPRTARRRRQTG